MGYRKEIDASTTVEAAFVIPLIVIVIFVFFRLLFFMYARIKIDADLDRAAREASERYVLYGAMTGEGSEGSRTTNVRVISLIFHAAVYVKENPV